MGNTEVTIGKSYGIFVHSNPDFSMLYFDDESNEAGLSGLSTFKHRNMESL